MYKKFNKGYYQNGGKTAGEWFHTINEHPVTEIVKILDPTGISSYGDVYNAWTDGEFTADDVLAPLSALPIVGKAGKAASGIYKGVKLLNKVNKSGKLAKYAGKVVKGYNKLANKNLLTKSVAGIGEYTALNAVSPLLASATVAGGVRRNLVPKVISETMNLPSKDITRLVNKLGPNSAKAYVARHALNTGSNIARVKSNWIDNEMSKKINQSLQNQGAAVHEYRMKNDPTYREEIHRLRMQNR